MVLRRERLHMGGVSNYDRKKHLGDTSYGKSRTPDLSPTEELGRSRCINKSFTGLHREALRPRALSPSKPTSLSPLRTPSVGPLKNASDLTKLKEIREGIKRRYLNRTDIRRIFINWDQGCTGGIRPVDMQAMLAKFGYSVTPSEAAALVATSNTSRSGYLNLSEFIEFVFPSGEVLDKVQSSRIGSSFEENPDPQTLFLMTLTSSVKERINTEIFDKRPPYAPKYASRAVLDIQQLPINKLDEINHQAKTIRHALRRVFVDSSSFQAALQKTSTDNAISLCDLEAVLRDNLGSRMREFEPFLTAHIYNKQGRTSIRGVVDQVFT